MFDENSQSHVYDHDYHQAPARLTVWDGYPSHTNGGHIGSVRPKEIRSLTGATKSQPRSQKSHASTSPLPGPPVLTSGPKTSSVPAPPTHDSVSSTAGTQAWSPHPAKGLPEFFWSFLALVFLAVVLAMSLTRKGRKILSIVYAALRYCVVGFARHGYAFCVLFWRIVTALARACLVAYKTRGVLRLRRRSNHGIVVYPVRRPRRRTYRPSYYQGTR